MLSAHLTNAFRFEEAELEARRAVELQEHYFVAWGLLGETLLAQGRVADALPFLERAHQLAPWNTQGIGLLAAAARRSGDPARAASLIEMMGDTPLPVWGRAAYHLHCDDLDDAARWYDRMIDERDPFAVIYANAPITQRLREHPRWPLLAARMNLPGTQQ